MKALVTGGGGFLGEAIVRKLRARGDDVTSFSRGHYPAIEALGARTVQGDVADAGAVLRAADGADLVFHVAAKPGVWGPAEAYEAANVRGTENVLEACRRHGIRRLVHTSSPSVVFGGHDEAGVDESVPYPGRYLAHYPRTKAISERAVLAANSADLATVALRPHLIWGPGDNHLVPRIVGRAKAGKLRLVGGGTNLVDHVYVDNAADAHLAAADRLAPGSAVAGKAYFVTNGEPLPIAELIGRILEAAGLPRERRSVSPAVAYAAGTVAEVVFKALKIESEPRMTRFLARQLSCAHWYDISAARRDLGYEPAVSTEEGMRRLATSLRGSA